MIFLLSLIPYEKKDSVGHYQFNKLRMFSYKLVFILYNIHLVMLRIYNCIFIQISLFVCIFIPKIL